MNLNLCVQDFINTQYLKPISKVVAGEKGLTKNVRWVHVLEIRDVIKECVDGNEMVLTTGIGFTNKEIALNFVQQLINQGVSALCIETALYYHSIDKELIQLANNYDFPIIEITEISRFVDISKGLNTMIINNESNYYVNADHYDDQLSEINSKGTIADGIRYTADYLDLVAAYLPFKGTQYASSPELKVFTRSKLAELNKMIKDEENYCKGNIAIKNLKIFGKNWGHLIFYSFKRDISQYELLILTRLSNKIRNDIYFDLLKKEEELYKDNGWIKQWLDGELSEVTISEKLRILGFRGKYKEFIVSCTTLPDKWNALEVIDTFQEDCRKLYYDFLLHTTIIVRRVFEGEGFSVLGYMEDSLLIYIIMIPNQVDDILVKIKNAIKELRDYSDEFINYSNSIFSIGKKVKKSTDLKKSYKTAINNLNSIEAQNNRLVLYDDLYIKRIVEHLKTEFDLDEFIEEQLGSLMEESNLELLCTLRAYYECNCSKQKTSEKLFIVRQTLYCRLQKIEDIIGNYTEGEKRIALEFAVNAYFYLNSNKLSACKY